MTKTAMTTQKTALVLGGGGFIGSHMVKRLKDEGYWVRAVDLVYPEFGKSHADHFVHRDLRSARDMYEVISYAGCTRNPYQTFARQFDKAFDEVYQFAADMGGAGYVFTGDNDANIMHNSSMINLNLLDAVVQYAKVKDSVTPRGKPKIFYSSSACVYPETVLNCREDSAYPANPDSEYGWEKLFSERLYESYSRNHGLDIRIARFHNIYGPFGTWKGGREKAPAAICRKVLKSNGEIEIWGDGTQTRSFLYINDCIDAVRLLMNSAYDKPINIGSEEMVSIGKLADMAIMISGLDIKKVYVDGPVGVMGRNSDNRLIEKTLNWKPKYTLGEGMELTYRWIEEQIFNE